MRNLHINHFQLKKYTATFLLVVTLFCTGSVEAKSSNNWKPLFGTNLTDADYSPQIWELKGNVLSAGPDECIWTMEEYNNFELDLEFNNEEGARSSIIIYCSDRDDWESHSIQICLADPQATKFGTNIPYEICGSICEFDIPARDGIVKSAGEWNHLRIRGAGGRISVIMNGRKVTEWNMAETLATPPTNGFIGLQGHISENPLRFRNVKIREISESERASTSTRKEREPRVFPEY